MVFLPLHSYPEPPCPRVLMEDGTETAGVSTSSFSSDFALILWVDWLKSVCFQLSSYRILIPFKKLPSHGRPSTQFLAPLSFFTFGNHVRLGPAPCAFESVTWSLESDLSAEMEWTDCPMLSLWTCGDYLPMAPGKFFSFSESWAKGHIWLHNSVTDLSGSWNYVGYAVK